MDWKGNGVAGARAKAFKGENKREVPPEAVSVLIPEHQPARGDKGTWKKIKKGAAESAAATLSESGAGGLHLYIALDWNCSVSPPNSFLIFS